MDIEYSEYLTTKLQEEAERYCLKNLYKGFEEIFIDGAKSNVAMEYWANEFSKIINKEFNRERKWVI